MDNTLQSIPAAHAWLIDQGFSLTEKTLRNHVDQGKLPAEKHRNGKVKQIRMLDLDRYARQWLDRKAGQDDADHRSRLIKEQADKIALENELKRGKYLDKEEEEQRDAMIMAGFRRHIENAAPDRLQGVLSKIMTTITDEKIRADIVARQPEWLAADLDFLADMFDGFGGV